MEVNSSRLVLVSVIVFLIIVYHCECETNDLDSRFLLNRKVRSPDPRGGGGFGGGGGGGRGGFGGGRGGFGGGRGGFGGGRGFGGRGLGRGYGGIGIGRGGFVVPPSFFRRRRFGRSVDGKFGGYHYLDLQGIS